MKLLLLQKVMGKFSVTKFKVFYKSKPPLNSTGANKQDASI